MLCTKFYTTEKKKERKADLKLMYGLCYFIINRII